MELSNEWALLNQQLAYSKHLKVRSQVLNPYMSMEQVQFGDNPYLNTDNSGWLHHPNPSWETSQNALQPPQEHNTCLEESMSKLARSQVEFTSSRAGMENSQVKISHK